jgi:hypothetical protein
MLKSAIVQFEGQDMLMSLAPWGPIRRWRVRRRGLDIAFVPKYELALFLGTPVLGDALTFVRSHKPPPELVLYFPDKATALQKCKRLKAAISQGWVPGALAEAFTYAADEALLAWGDPPRSGLPFAE